MAILNECVLARPNISDLQSDLAAELSKRLLGGGPVLPKSVEDVLSFVMAGAVNLMFGAVTQALRESDPATMCCDGLVLYGAAHGIDLNAATRAKGYAVISGTPGALIPRNLRLVGPRSTEYKFDPAFVSNPTSVDSTGHASVRIVAVVAGKIFNARAGTPLTVATTTPGISMTATIVGNGLTGGEDDEDCEAYRARVLEVERSELMVPNEAWYLRESARYPGVTRVCTDECEGCCDPGFVPLYPFMEGVYGDTETAPYGVPPCGVLDEMTDWMFGKEPGRGQGKAPIGIRGQYLAANPVVLDLTARCLSGCPIGAEDRIKEALIAYVRVNFCVGSTVCKDQLRAELYRALGQDNCLSDVQFHYGTGIRFEDATNIYLDCGYFFVIGSVTLSQTFQ